MNWEIARTSRALEDLEVSQVSEKKEERRCVKLSTRFTEKYSTVENTLIAKAQGMEKMMTIQR